VIKETIGNATLYLGRCEEVLPSLDGYQAVLTDPPYGTGWVRGGGKLAGEFNAKHEKPDWDVFSTNWLALVKAPVIAAFCAPSLLHRMCAAFPAPRVARYKKTNVRPGGSEYEFIVSNSEWRGDDWQVEAYNGDNEYHPTQKPVPVMVWAVDRLQATGTILDPYMGSGSTGVACAMLERPFIGIEENAAYFYKAYMRIENALRQERLFA
jgi:site-specific DNA-methyltransferase (adenine-specific)/modification methylase